MQIKSRAYQRAALAAQWDHVVAGNFSGPAYNLHAHLVTAFTGSPTDQTAWADVTEATFHGYAVAAVVLPTAVIDSVESADGLCDMIVWAATDNVVPEVVIAIVYTDNAVAGNVMGIDVLAVPQAMADATSGFGAVPIIDLPWQTNGKPAVIVS